MSNGLFGDLDMDEIPENPFFIEEGYYQFIVTKAQWEEYTPNDGSGNVYNNTTYTVTVDVPDSAYHAKPVQQRFARYPNISRAELEEMEPKAKQDVLAALSRHINFLRGLGLSETEINQTGESEEATLELVQGRVFTAKYKENTSKAKGDGEAKVYRNLSNMKPVADSEPEDSSNMEGYEF